MSTQAKPSVLVTCPDYDMMTRYLSAWAHIFIAAIKQKGNLTYTLESERANQKNFHGIIKKTKPKVIFINGHGAEDRVAGHDHKVIANKESASIFKDAVVYALSCKSAQVLGSHAVARGAKGYIGYSQDFILVSQPNKTTHPEDDKTAALFLDPSNAIAESLSKGRTAKTATEKGKKEFAKSINKALNSDIQSDDDKYVPYLMWNRQFLCSK